MASKTLYQGVCVGGPMDGMDGQSRCSKGFVLINAPDGKVWVYDAQRVGTSLDADAQLRFVAREQDVLDKDKAEKAAASDTYDVRAYDPELMGG